MSFSLLPSPRLSSSSLPLFLAGVVLSGPCLSTHTLGDLNSRLIGLPGYDANNPDCEHYATKTDAGSGSQSVTATPLAIEWWMEKGARGHRVWEDNVFPGNRIRMLIPAIVPLTNWSDCVE